MEKNNKTEVIAFSLDKDDNLYINVECTDPKKLAMLITNLNIGSFSSDISESIINNLSLEKAIEFNTEAIKIASNLIKEQPVIKPSELFNKKGE